MINWTLMTLPIDELRPYDHNPRVLTLSGKNKLKSSLEKFGLAEKPVINSDKTIISGHQRIELCREAGDETITCWVPDVELSAADIKELNIRLNRNNGDWDWDILGNEFEMGDLLDWGFDDAELVQDTKPKKKAAPAITFEFEDIEHLQRLLPECEKISAIAECKMKVRG